MISELEANELCECIVQRMSAWGALDAALQSGGLEQKANHLIASALEGLAAKHASLLLREYRHADFVFVVPDAMVRATLNVRTVVEIKFNYARQTSEILNRVPDALEQAARYRRTFEAEYAYVLYLVAAPAIENVPSPRHPRDSGWGYWDRSPVVAETTLQEAINALEEAAETSGSQVRGSATGGGPTMLYAALLQANAQ